MHRPTNTCRNSASASAARRLAGPLARDQRVAERLKQRAVDRIALRIVLRMPLHAEREARRIRNPDRLDRAVLGDPLDHHPFAGLQDALAVKRIDADGLAPQQRCKGAAGNQIDVMAVGENYRGIRICLLYTSPSPRD